MLTNNISSNPNPYMVVPFYWFLYIENKYVNIGRGKRCIKQQINLNHKVKHKIGSYLKYHLIFTAYQVQGWWIMILSPVKYQQYGSNLIEIIPKSSWNTHLNIPSHTYLFYKSEETSIWILHSSLLCLINHTPIWWFILD